jgi:hypothetical protein
MIQNPIRKLKSVLAPALCLAALASTPAAAQFGTFASYIWSDKYTYQPGESITVRWTVKTNGDTGPYVLVAYRQNNQTGKKYYLPAGTETATDIFGNKPADGMNPIPIGDTTKQILAGEGGLIPALSVPEQYGMHTLVVQFRDPSGIRIIKSNYMKIGVVKGTTLIDSNITESRTLTNDTLWQIKGNVFVKGGATLTIEPGTFIMGLPGSQPASALLITRDGRIIAEGTKSRPIVMTSSLPFGQRQRGDWGGLVMMGRAPINVGANVTVGGQPVGNPEGEFFLEGLPGNPDTTYGGMDPEHDCGSLRYVRVEYAGSIFAPNSELNSFTWAGCGSKTKAEYLQASYGLDDAFEWFGGNANARYLVGGLGADDFVDYQLGWTGKAQFGLFYQSPDERGNRGIEADNSEYLATASPLSKPQLYNMTFIGSKNQGVDEPNSPGIYLRRNAGGILANMLVSDFYSTGFFLDGSNTQSQVGAGNITVDGVLLWGNGIGTNSPNTVEGQVQPQSYALITGNPDKMKNFTSENPRFRRAFEYSDPDFRGQFNSPLYRLGWVAPPDDGFFDSTVTFLGGIGEYEWTEEWTSFLRDFDIKP